MNPAAYLGSPNCRIGNDRAWCFAVDGENYRMGLDAPNRVAVLVRSRDQRVRVLPRRDIAEAGVGIDTRANLEAWVRHLFDGRPLPRRRAPPAGLHPLAAQVLDVLRDLSESPTDDPADPSTLDAVYNIQRHCSAPLDEAVYKWIDAGCPLASRPPGQESS